SAGGTGSRISAMRVRLAIGDFSRMTHLSVKALRHYHDVGLLVPAEIDPASGYRCYEPGQVPLAQVIRRFRDLGMPLNEIREVLQASDVGGPQPGDSRAHAADGVTARRDAVRRGVAALAAGTAARAHRRRAPVG